MNQNQYNLIDQLEAEADKGMNPDHPMWAISATKAVLEIIRDNIRIEDVPYIAQGVFEFNNNAIGLAVATSCRDILEEFAGEADL